MAAPTSLPDPRYRDVLRQPGQEVFLNTRLMAANALEIDIDAAILAELAEPATETPAMTCVGETYALTSGVRLYTESPSATWGSDIRWLSHADEPSYRWFEALYQRLGLASLIAPFIPHDAAIRLYAGFFVTRSRCDALGMHYDWATEGNHAFTLMAPLTPNAEAMGLTYEDARGRQRMYDYRMGHGIVFGTRFLHSTAVGTLPERSVFLSLTFGTDRMEHWPELSETAGKQAAFFRQPDGAFVRRDDWLAARAGG